MKKYAVFTVIQLTMCLALNKSIAQDCPAYYPMKEGSVMELTSYNEKGKPQMIITSTIKSVEGSGMLIKLNVHSESKDEKLKPISNSDYEAICDHGIFSISMKNLT